MCVIKSPLKLWVTRVFPFSLTTVSKHCLLNYFALIPYLAKAAGQCEDMWNLIAEWGDSIPRPQVASFSVLHTNTALDFFFFCILLCVWETISTVTVCLLPHEWLLSLVTFVVGMHVWWYLPEEFICGVSGLYNQGRNGWKIILGEVIKTEGICSLLDGLAFIWPTPLLLPFLILKNESVIMIEIKDFLLYDKISNINCD